MAAINNPESRIQNPKLDILLFILCIACYLILRLVKLTILPVFNDEAFYIHWAAIIHEYPRSLWMPLVDGKTPLFYWANALTIGWFEDPLFSGRIISAASGFTTIVLFYLAGHSLGRPRSGLIAGWLYALLPFAFFNDRLGTVDSFHTTLVIACLYTTIRASQDGGTARTGGGTPSTGSFSWAWASILGIVMSAAFMAKTPTLLFVPLPALMILILRNDRWQQSTLLKLALAYSILLATIIIYLTRDVPIIGEGGSRIFHRGRFFIPMDKLLEFPLAMWANNLRDVGDYLWAYFTLPLALAGLAATLAALRRRRWMTLMIALWTLFPMAAMLLLTRETFSRYYLVVLTPLLLVIGLEANILLEWSKGLPKLGKRLVIALFLTASVLYSGFSISFIVPYLKDPSGALWVKRDRWQYIEGYPSGYGIDRVVNYLRGRAAKNRITVFTTMNWGNPADAVWIYLHGESNVQVVECFWWDRLPVIIPDKEALPVINNKFQREIAGNILLRDMDEAYFVVRSMPFSREVFETINPGAILVLEVTKPGGEDATYLYRIQ